MRKILTNCMKVNRIRDAQLAGYAFSSLMIIEVNYWNIIKPQGDFLGECWIFSYSKP
jgi:hypothetical protein